MILFGQQVTNKTFSNEVHEAQNNSVLFWLGFNSFGKRDLKNGVISDDMISWIGIKSAKRLVKLYS